MGVRPMAAASLDQARIIAFALEHGTSAAARRFRISDSYVRRLKRSAESAPLAATPAVPAAPTRPGLRVVDAPSVPVSRFTELYAPLPNYAGNERAFWRCPVCNEFVRSPLDARRNDWEQEQKRLHSHGSKPATASVMSAAPTPAPTISVPEPVCVSEASESDKSAVPVPVLGSAVSVADAPSRMLVAPSPASSPRFVVVMDIVALWLVEYWRVPLAIALGLVIICWCL